MRTTYKQCTRTRTPARFTPSGRFAETEGLCVCNWESNWQPALRRDRVHHPAPGQCSTSPAFRIKVKAGKRWVAGAVLWSSWKVIHEATWKSLSEENAQNIVRSTCYKGTRRESDFPNRRRARIHLCFVCVRFRVTLYVYTRILLRKNSKDNEQNCNGNDHLWTVEIWRIKF